MESIELSLCSNPDQKSTFLTDLLNSLPKELTHDFEVIVHPMLWENYSQEITSMALYNKGSDVSQVGFPLTEDLIAMNALIPISPKDLSRLGGEDAFHPTIWKIARRHHSDKIWSLPWMVDPRAIFYWKDLLGKANVDPADAFKTAESMEDACQRMKDSGIESPWVLGMEDKFVIIHSIVSWVWGKGGDFISPGGNRASFLEKEALDGLEAYFRLQPFMPNGGRPISVAEAKRTFTERKAAITLGPYGSLDGFLASVPAEHRDLLGVALPPGPPLIAGSDLICWRHSRKTTEMVKLLSLLFNTEVQIKYSDYLGNIPVTKKALDDLAKLPDANVKTFISTLDNGRIFATSKFAGVLEIQLAGALAGLWRNLSEHPAANLRESLQTALSPLQRRFDMMHTS